MILAGELKDGDGLPSIRQLAKDLRISVITAARAYSELEQEGFVATMQGKGCFVLPRDTEMVREQYLRRVEEYLLAAIDDARVAGIVRVLGRDNIKDELEIKQEIGFVSDECLFLDEWTCEDAGRAMRIFHKKWDDVRFADYLHRFKLPSRHKIKDLSKGMKMKLMLAAALSHDARLLLDEPTSGLDPAVRLELLDILREYACDGYRSVLFSTHITSDLEKSADFITFINQGRLVLSEAKDDAMEAYVVVKGGEKDLTPELEKFFIGIRHYRFGFEALMHTRDMKSLPAGLVADPATLDDIVVFHTMGVRK